MRKGTSSFDPGQLRLRASMRLALFVLTSLSLILLSTHSHPYVSDDDQGYADHDHDEFHHGHVEDNHSQDDTHQTEPDCGFCLIASGKKWALSNITACIVTYLTITTSYENPLSDAFQGKSTSSGFAARAPPQETSSAMN